jgi:hypothetical protein
MVRGIDQASEARRPRSRGSPGHVAGSSIRRRMSDSEARSAWSFWWRWVVATNLGWFPGLLLGLQTASLLPEPAVVGRACTRAGASGSRPKLGSGGRHSPRSDGASCFRGPYRASHWLGWLARIDSGPWTGFAPFSRSRATRAVTGCQPRALALLLAIVPFSSGLIAEQPRDCGTWIR